MTALNSADIVRRVLADRQKSSKLKRTSTAIRPTSHRTEPTVIDKLSDEEFRSVCDEVIVDRELGERSLRDYAEMCWPKVFPGDPFIKGAWHNDCLADHLQALLEGQIKKLLISMPPGHGKPVADDSLILLSSGDSVRLGDLQVGASVITHTGEQAVVLEVHRQGRLPCLRIHTYCGREVTAAYDHPFLTPDGWVLAKDLSIGQYLSLIPSPATHSIASESLEEFRLTGYFIGDGCVTNVPGNSCNSNITCADPTELIDIKACATKLGFTYSERPDLYRISLLGGARTWLRDKGLAGSNSHTKRVPSWVFQGSTIQIANFVGAYFATDGCVTNKGHKWNLQNREVSWSSVNRSLLLDVQHLLLRLSIQSRIRKRTVNFHGKVFVAYVLSLNGQDEITKFTRIVPVHHSVKPEKLRRWLTHKSRFEPSLFTDKIVDITPVGLVECSCITLDNGSHSFTANDLIVHNSSYAAVYLPTFAWVRMPYWKMIYGSHTFGLTERDGGRCRDLIKSKWWQERWGHKFDLTSIAARNLTTSLGGIRAGVTIGSQTLGHRGHLVVADDPLDVQEVDSELKRANVIHWWKHGMRSRGDKDQRELVIMQRLHFGDLVGYLQNEIGGYEELILPAEYERSMHCVTFTVDRTKFWEDPRKKDGEVLFPQKFPKDFLDSKKGKTDHDKLMHAAMYQQRPMIPGGNIIKKNWFRFYQESPEKQYEQCTSAILSCDLAEKDKITSTWTVIQIWGIRYPNIYLIDQLRQRLSFTAEVAAILAMVAKWNNAKGPVLSAKLIEDKANGPAVMDVLKDKVQGITPFPGDDDKEERMHAISWLWEAGNVYVPGRPSNDGTGTKIDFSLTPWMDEFYDEVIVYPKAQYNDQAITMSQALLHIARSMKHAVGVPTVVTGPGTISKLQEMTKHMGGRYI